MRFTPAQQRILQVLSDGRAHCRDELLEKVHDDRKTEVSTLRWHISEIRKVLERRGQGIVCENLGGRRQAYYRWVRFIASAYDGRT